MQTKIVFFVSILLLCSANVLSQNSNFEIGIVTDNDLYISTKNDQYYTNGLQIFYRYLSKKSKPQVLKKINDIRIGQFIYTPRQIYIDDEQVFDRPYAGYLFGEFGITNFYSNQSVFKKHIQVGYVGPNSFADKVQLNTHKLFKYDAIEQWDYQIKNTLGIQIYGMYSKPFLSSINSKRIDFQWQSEAKLGTVFTALSTGFVTRIGIKKLALISDSNFYGASLSPNDNSLKNEFYFYVAPSFNCQLYDTTIQGGIFENNSPVTFDLIPFRFYGEAGLKFRDNNLNISFAFVYRGKEVNFDSNMGYYYGSIGVSYLFTKMDKKK